MCNFFFPWKMNILGNVKIRGLINMSTAREGDVC